MRAWNRHCARREKARKRHILRTHYRRHSPRKPWQGYHRLCMNEPGWWVREFVLRPARSRSRHLCQLIKIDRCDPDAAIWPDYRRPHVYYW